MSLELLRSIKLFSVVFRQPSADLPFFYSKFYDRKLHIERAKSSSLNKCLIRSDLLILVFAQMIRLFTWTYIINFIFFLKKSKLQFLTFFYGGSEYHSTHLIHKQKFTRGVFLIDGNLDWIFVMDLFLKFFFNLWPFFLQVHFLSNKCIFYHFSK